MVSLRFLVTGDDKTQADFAVIRAEADEIKARNAADTDETVEDQDPPEAT